MFFKCRLLYIFTVEYFLVSNTSAVFYFCIEAILLVVYCYMLLYCCILLADILVYEYTPILFSAYLVQIQYNYVKFT